jgi:hypothetical protein
MSTMIRLKNADDTISRVLAPRLMDSESLAVHVQTGVLAALSTLKPFIEELWKRFDALEDGETIAGCTTRKEYCEQILNRTPRAVRYMLDGGNNHRQKHTPALPTGETVSPLSPDENDELELPVRKDTEAFAAIDRHIAAVRELQTLFGDSGEVARSQTPERFNVTLRDLTSKQVENIAWHATNSEWK